MGHRGVLALALMLTVLGASLTPMLRQAWALALAVGLAGAAMGYMQPLSMSLISGRAMAGTQGLALGLRISMNQVAQVIAPPIYGLAVAGYGVASAFYVAAAVAACGFIGLNRMARWQETSPERGPGRSSSSDVLR